MAQKAQRRAVKKKAPASRRQVKAATKAPDYLAADIGARIMQARRQAGLETIAALHKKTASVDRESKGISQPVLKGYEDGQFKPGARELRLLSLALDVSANWLLFGKQQASPEAEPGTPTKQSVVADYAGITDSEKTTVFLAMFLLKLPASERDGLLRFLEATLRTRMGDKQFDMFFEAIKAAAELTAGPHGIAGGLGEKLFAMFPEEAQQEFVEVLRKKAAELGIPMDEAREAVSADGT